MASSFITKDDTHGFWINDSLMKVVCWGIVSTIDAHFQNSDLWLKQEMREHIYFNSQGYFVGFMHLRLGEFLTTRDREDLFKNVMEKTKKFFLDKGEYISIQELNDFQLTEDTKHEWLTPLATSVTINVLRFLEKVLNNTIDIKSSDEITYEF